MSADVAIAPELFIGGSFRASAGTETFDTVDPATERVLATLPEATPADLDLAVAAALHAQREWRGAPWQRRANTLRNMADALEAHAEELARLDVADSGNPIVAMRNDVAGGLAELRFYAGLASEVKGSTQPASGDSVTFTERTPYGVVGRLVPYNHPFKAAVGKIAAPLAAGNAVILKPSEYAPLSALRMARLIDGILPAGLLSVLTGQGAGIGADLVGHPLVPRISFTGSVPTGRAVLRSAAEHIKHVTVELGGKNPFVLFPDADVRRAAQAAVKGMNLARSSGQSCQSTSRIYVHADIKAAFLDALLEVVAGLTIGDPHDESTDLGPLSYRQHYDRVLNYIASGRSDGATLLAGGGRPAALERGYYVAPTIFSDVTDDMTVAREEIFGPVMSVLEWIDPADVIERANNTQYGLTANIWTANATQALRSARAIDAGYVFVNSQGKRPLGAPFGGWKASGLGKGSTIEELISYTREKSITIEIGD
jgi:betaine-aldehyde dehydrogenase